MRFPKETGDHRHRQQQQKQRVVADDCRAKRNQRDGVLPHGKNLPNKADAPNGLAACALHPVVEFGVLEVIKVQRGGVLHQPNAGVVAEQIPQKAFHQR
ncbi:MAG: hypothetical protein UZ07_CHB004002725 [Chlorobi bacterium OLB7]|nr:MAG: hypothetical protein UZ07_CHB004002725 [Chlorobi bacterium OLB7]